MQINNAKEQSVQQSTVDNNIQQPIGSLWTSLDRMESVLWKMLVGIFRFIFIKLPKWLIELIKEWSPTFFKLVKVTSLFILIFCIAVVPGCYALNHPDSLETGIKWGLYFWSTSAIVGALWGIRKIKLPENGLFKAVRAIFSKNSERGSSSMD